MKERITLLFENTNHIPGIEKSYFLAHYKPRSQGGNDKLSSYLLSFKDGNKEAVGHWVEYAAKEFETSNLSFDVIIRALGSNEVVYTPGHPLDDLGKKLAGMTQALYLPEIIQKTHANQALKYLPASARHEALRGIFKFDSSKVSENANILIIDDVITTGATIKEMCRTIKVARPDIVIHFFTLTKTFDTFRDEDQNEKLLDLIVSSKPLRKNPPIHKASKLQADSIQEYGGFFLESILENIHNEQRSELKALLSSLSSFDIKSTKSLEPEPMSSDVKSPFDVLYNMIQRGLPTRASFQIEKKIQEALGLFEYIELLGGIGFRINTLSPELSEMIVDSLNLVDPRIDIHDLTFQYTNSWEQLDSTYEEEFYLKQLSNLSGKTPWMIQYVYPQRSIKSIVKVNSNNTKLEQNFVDQRCDFAIEFPVKIRAKSGIVIEVDGPHHNERGQKELDRTRDIAIQNAGWMPTIRIPVQKWSQIDSYLKPLTQISESDTFTRVRKNYESPLYDTPDGLTALQLTLSPLLMGRIQKTLLRAILDRHLDLHDKKWTICIIERDVPGSSLAISDLFEQISHLSNLLEHSIELPQTKIKIYSTDKFINAPLHRVSTDAPSLIDEIGNDFTSYDLVIDISILARIDYWKPVKFPVAAKSYLSLKSSMFTESRRKFRTGKLLDYKELTKITVKDGKEEEVEIPELKDELEYFLINIFRKKRMKAGQIPILHRALRQKSVIGLLPTGGGKSLTYQLSTLLQPGITLVIDPIKSLMRDQVNSLFLHHIDCADFINSSLSRKEKDFAHRRLTTGDVLFFFVSPERFQLQDFRDVLRASQSYENYFSYAVIDESHCVSEWGHNFRTSYLFLGKNAKRYAKTFSEEGMTLFGLTATASYDVLADIQRELTEDIENMDSILSDDAIVRFETFNRPEIQYEVIPARINAEAIYNNEWKVKEDLGLKKHVEIIKLLSSIPAKIESLNSDPDSVYIPITDIETTTDKSKLFENIHISNYNPENFWNEQNTNAAIIFCPHRSWYFGVTDKYKNNDRSKVGIYDSIIKGIPDYKGKIGTFIGADDTIDSNRIDEDNIKNQAAFTNDQINMMIATKAFGMGIDKPNVRFSIHLNYPESLESFVQEAGRIGRDGKTALACIVYNDQKFQVRQNDQSVKLINFDRQILDDFYSSSFPGKEKEKRTLYELLSAIRIAPIKNLETLTAEIKNQTGEEYRFEFKTSQAGRDYLVVYRSLRHQVGIIFLDTLQVKAKDSDNSQDENPIILNRVVEELRKVVPENASISGWLNQTEGTERSHGIEELLSVMTLGKERTIQVSFTNDLSALEDRVRNTFERAGVTKIDLLMRGYRSSTSIESYLESLRNIEKGDQEVIRNCYNSRRTKQDTEKALYRLALIGVVSDYTIDFNRKIFNVTITKRTTEEYERYLRSYVRRYYSDNKTDRIMTDVRELKGENYVQQSLNFITEFLYKEIALKRWKAIDAVEEACRVGAEQSNGAMKEYIDVYFNSKYGRRGYEYEYQGKHQNGSLADRTDEGKSGDLDVVWDFIDIAIEYDTSGAELVNLKHLRGACVRFLNPNPTNVALLLLKAFCTLILEETRVITSTLIPEAIIEISKGLEILILDEQVGMEEITEANNRYFNKLLGNTSSHELRQRLTEIKAYQVAHSNRVWIQTFNERFLDQNE